ncbi:LEA type 2 family protein [Salinispirillum marinum]|uniref:LEA type 2 family protein n=2 Tax=Saccharospirillaceae TaxID=255527 RepID=A0ABV8BCM4_9GAMM
MLYKLDRRQAWTGLLQGLLGWTVIFWLSGCASLPSTAWQEPEVNILSSRLVGLSPTAAQLETRVEINNPNLFAITMGALDYELTVNERRVVAGEQRQGNTLAAGGSTVVSLPIEVVFTDVLSLVSELQQADRFAYAMVGGMSFDVPVFGRVRVPLAAQGEVPIPRLPAVQVVGLRAERLSLSSADLVLNLALTNPNAFGLRLDQFTYELALNQSSVASGKVQQTVSLNEGGQAVVEVPIRLLFIDAGLALYDALLRGQTLDYGLAFESQVGTGLPIMDAFPFSVVQDGRVQLRR